MKPITDEDRASAAAAYADVDGESWFLEAVAFNVKNGLFTGTSGDTFAPDENTTRAQFITVLARAAGVDTNGGGEWYDKAVEWAKSTGISDGTNLLDNITREQIVTMLWRFAGQPAASGRTNFTDDDAIDDWAKAATAWASDNGIIVGYEDSTFRPLANATRAEVATMLMRYIQSIM
jgi:hypothetical protein